MPVRLKLIPKVVTSFGSVTYFCHISSCFFKSYKAAKPIKFKIFWSFYKLTVCYGKYTIFRVVLLRFSCSILTSSRTIERKYSLACIIDIAGRNVFKMTETIYPSQISNINFQIVKYGITICHNLNVSVNLQVFVILFYKIKTNLSLETVREIFYVDS